MTTTLLYYIIGTVVTLLATVGFWIWNRARGNKQAAFLVMLLDTVEEEILKALASGEARGTIEQRLTELVMDVAQHLDIKVSRFTVLVAVQYAFIRLKRILAHRDLSDIVK